MIAYEELVVALTNWRVQQGLGTTGLQFSSQRSGRVDLDLPVADPDSLVEEIVDADLDAELVSMDAVEEVDAMVDPSSLMPKSAEDAVLYEDGEHTSIGEAEEYSASEDLSGEGAQPAAIENLDFGNDDTQYMEAPDTPDEVAIEASGDIEEAPIANELGQDIAQPAPLVEEEISIDPVPAELDADAPIEMSDLEVEEEAVVEEEHNLVEEEVIDAAGLEEEVIDAAGLEVEESVESASIEIDDELLSEGDPSAVGEFSDDESTMMGMGASAMNLAPGNAEEKTDLPAPSVQQDDE